jgi:hypothetical protein
VAWPLSVVSGGSTTTLSHRRLAGAVAGDETYVGTICELVHQVHDRACNSAAAVPIVRRALARQDARTRQMIFWGMVRPRWWCSSVQRRGKKPYCAMRRGASRSRPRTAPRLTTCSMPAYQESEQLLMESPRPANKANPSWDMRMQALQTR